MKNENQQKSLGFTIFVDEDTHDLFNIFFSLYASLDHVAEGNSVLNKDEKVLRMRETFQRLLDSVIDPSHELGWCKDPECEWTPNDKKGHVKK